MKFKMSLFGLLVLIAGLIALIAVFLAWATGYGHSASGWDVFDIDGHKYRYFPLIVLIVAILVILVGFFELFEIKLLDEMLTRILVIIFGVLIFVLPLLVALDMRHPGISMGIGLILEFVAGLILIIVPLLAMFKLLPEIK